MELKAIIEKELEQNPVLEEIPPQEVKTTEDEPTRETEPAPDSGEPPAEIEYETTAQSDTGAPVDDFDAEFQRLAQLDEEWRNQILETQGVPQHDPDQEEKRRFMFDSLTAGPTLHQFLLEQLALSDLSKDKMRLAELIIGNIDEHGYLKATVEELAADAGTTPDQILDVLKVVQSFDPPGVGARDLRECLLLQLERAGRQHSLEYKIVADHFNDLVKRRIPQIAKFLNVPLDQVQTAVRAISNLDPKPGRQFAPDTDTYVVPDVYVYKSGNEYVVTLNEDELPRIRISNVYKDIMTRTRVDLDPFLRAFADAPDKLKNRAAAVEAAVKSGRDSDALGLLRSLATNPELTPQQQTRISELISQLTQRQTLAEAKKYIKEKIRAGKFLIKSIHQRQQTILNIAREIVTRQREFLDKGIAHLKPMTMAQIAEAVGVHETTVSRAISGKYIQTPQGLFEMKFFFTTGIPTDTGQGLSNTTVKNMIADIFKNEDPHNPVSDQQVVELLRAKGIKIARRTVAKYRAELNILPSHLRKAY